jgi:hypothetical protein
MAEDVVTEDIVKHYVFVKKGRRHYAPQYLTAGMTTVKWIFSIPESNAIGTLDGHSNGIVAVKFGDYGAEPECRVIALHFSDTVYGPFDYRFSPNFSEETIAYSKTRAAIISNVKTGETFHAGYGLSMTDYMLGIRFLDPQENLFAIVKSIKIKNGRGWENYLHVAKLEDQQFFDTAWVMRLGAADSISPDFPLYNTWFVHDKKLFAYEQERGKVLCTDGKHDVFHSFSEAYNVNSNRIGKVKDFAIHPKLPFGVMIDEDVYKTHDLTLLRWDVTDSKKKAGQVLSFGQYLKELKPLFNMDRITLAYQSFSPDGNWYVVGCIASDEPKNPHFIAIPVLPVDKKHSDFLDADNLVVLGQVKNLTSVAWTSEPTSYVVSNGKLLHKWDLDELPDARVFVMPADGAGNGSSIFRGVGRMFGGGK